MVRRVLICGDRRRRAARAFQKRMDVRLAQIRATKEPLLRALAIKAQLEKEVHGRERN